MTARDEPTSTAEKPDGDQACWLNLVCDVCGAINERADESCWRCDTPVDAAR
ncbi:MAG: hypothetical protein ABWX65_02095 [Mycetocola sp.]